MTSPSPPSKRRVEVLGCHIDALTMGQTLARCEELIADGAFAQHVSMNAAKLIAMRDDPELSEIVARCELVSADGQSVVWASRILGQPLPERVAGVDLMQELLALAERRGYRVYILGAKRQVLESAIGHIRSRHPALAVAGYRDGYFSDDQMESVAQEVRVARPHILFVAISSPRKEYFLGRYGRDIGVPFVMGVGGSIDVVAGLVRRAPARWQRLGLEWLYRLGQEPRRLLRRYVATNGRFLGLVALAWARRGPSRGHARARSNSS